MSDNPKTPQRSSVSVICILGACYLLYTAFQLFHLLGSGQADSPALCVVGGGVLGLAGAFLLGWQWKIYRREKRQAESEKKEEEQE